MRLFRNFALFALSLTFIRAASALPASITDYQSLNRFLKGKASKMILNVSIPTIGKRTVLLDYQKVFSGKITNAKGREIQLAPRLFMQGRVMRRNSECQGNQICKDHSAASLAVREQGNNKLLVLKFGVGVGKRAGIFNVEIPLNQLADEKNKHIAGRATTPRGHKMLAMPFDDELTLPEVDPKTPKIARAVYNVNEPSVCGKREMTIAVAADYEAFQLYGSNAPNAAYALQEMINSAEAIYSTTFNVSFKVTKIVIHDTANDPYTSTSTSPRLASFRDYSNANPTYLDASDSKFLFSGITPVPFDAVGRAYLGTMCDIYQTYGALYMGPSFLNSGYLFTKPWLYLALAHELGHNFNADHTQPAPTTNGVRSIMYPELNSTTYFASSSIATINSFLNSPNGACITANAACPAAPATSTPTATPTRPPTTVPTTTPTPTATPAAAAVTITALSFTIGSSNQATISWTSSSSPSGIRFSLQKRTSPSGSWSTDFWPNTVFTLPYSKVDWSYGVGTAYRVRSEYNGVSGAWVEALTPLSSGNAATPTPTVAPTATPTATATPTRTPTPQPNTTVAGLTPLTFNGGRLTPTSRIWMSWQQSSVVCSANRSFNIESQSAGGTRTRIATGLVVSPQSTGQFNAPDLYNQPTTAITYFVQQVCGNQVSNWATKTVN